MFPIVATIAMVNKLQAWGQIQLTSAWNELYGNNILLKHKHTDVYILSVATFMLWM